MLVAMRAKLAQFQTRRGIAAVLGGGVTGNTSRSLVGIGTALRTFQRNNDANTFSHESCRLTELNF